MAPPERIYRGSIRALSVVFIGLGLMILATTLAAGGGPVSVGVVLGLAFVAVGAGRLWLATRMGR
ncbi:MAG TPA: hypothetical protein VFZ41_00880 [Solirubrobacterales bacterium]